MGIEKKVLSIRLDESFIDELKIAAKEENRNLSNFIETVLKQYFETKSSSKNTRRKN